MRITATQYAKALYATTEGRPEKEITGLISNLVKILQKNRQIKLVSEIYKKFNEIWNQEEGIVEAEVITSRKLESSQVHKVENYIKEKYQAKEVVLRSIVDEKIQGGIIIRVGDEILDGSISRQLKKLEKELVE